MGAYDDAAEVYLASLYTAVTGASERITLVDAIGAAPEWIGAAA